MKMQHKKTQQKTSNKTQPTKVSNKPKQASKRATHSKKKFRIESQQIVVKESKNEFKEKENKQICRIFFMQNVTKLWKIKESEQI